MNLEDKKHIHANWDFDTIYQIYQKTIPDLLFHAMKIHNKFNNPSTMQLNAILSIKTGACSEDCKYCAQSSHHKTDIKPQKMLSLDQVIEVAKQAKKNGAMRFCMGAAWKEVKTGNAFEQVLEMVRAVRDIGMETCVTLGMLDKEHAEKLAQAGLNVYNHNLDTSREYYPKIVTTHSFDDRLQTLKNIREAGIAICSGIIIGMGEDLKDRIAILNEYARMKPHPENLPINVLVKIKGSLLEDVEATDTFDLIRLIATARIIMPKTRLRLSAGRKDMSREAQTLCFLAGVNSIFTGDNLLTTKNYGQNNDLNLLKVLGIKPE